MKEVVLGKEARERPNLYRRKPPIYTSEFNGTCPHCGGREITPFYDDWVCTCGEVIYSSRPLKRIGKITY